MKKLLVTAITFAVLMTAFSSTVPAEKNSSGYGTSTVSRGVQTSTLQKGEFDLPFETTGQLQPIRVTWVSPEITGVVAEMMVEIGDTVKKGDVLFKLSDTYYKMEYETARLTVELAKDKLDDALAGTRKEDVEAAKLAVENAQIALEKAERDFKRAQELYSNGSIPKTQFDDAKTAYESAIKTLEVAKTSYEKAVNGATDTKLAILRTGLEQAKQALELAKQRLEDCTVIAPFTGVVTERAISEGSFTGPGEHHIRLLDNTVLRFAVGIPERYAAYVKTGMQAGIHFNGTSIRRDVDLVVPMVNPSNRTITAYSTIDNSELGLPAYLFGEVELSIRVKGFVVETSALVYRGQKAFICNLTEDDKAHFVQVKPGISSGPSIAISGDLTDGMRYVIRKASDIEEGQQLRVDNE